MKKIGKIFLSLALVLIMVVPTLFMSGCDLFGKKGLDLTAGKWCISSFESVNENFIPSQQLSSTQMTEDCSYVIFNKDGTGAFYNFNGTLYIFEVFNTFTYEYDSSTKVITMQATGGSISYATVVSNQEIRIVGPSFGTYHLTLNYYVNYV